MDGMFAGQANRRSRALKHPDLEMAKEVFMLSGPVEDLRLKKIRRFIFQLRVQGRMISIRAGRAGIRQRVFGFHYCSSPLFFDKGDPRLLTSRRDVLLYFGESVQRWGKHR
jgi:hypothetical protein